MEYLLCILLREKDIKTCGLLDVESRKIKQGFLEWEMGVTFLGRWAEKVLLKKWWFEQRYERGEKSNHAAVWGNSASCRGKIRAKVLIKKHQGGWEGWSWGREGEGSRRWCHRANKNERSYRMLKATIRISGFTERDGKPLEDFEQRRDMTNL